MSDQEIIEKVNTILKEMDDFFHEIEPSLSNGISRDVYFAEHPEIKDRINYNFSLSADDIIKNKIPYKIAGCTGRAKMFSALAQKYGLQDFYIIPTVRTDAIGIKGKGQIPGHQLVAVKLSSGLVLIDPGKGKSFEKAKVNGKCAENEHIDSMGTGKSDHTIAKILTPEEYATIDSYEKMKQVYYSCATAKRILMSRATMDMNKKIAESTTDNAGLFIEKTSKEY